MADPNERSERKSDPPAAESNRSAIEPQAGKKAKSVDPNEIRDRNRRIREEAAQKRRAKHATEPRRVAPARNLDTTEIVDDALARTTHVVSNWAKKHFAIIQWLVLLLFFGGIGYQIYSYRHGVNAARFTDELNQAVRAERGRVGEGESAPDEYTGLADMRPVFPNDAARLKAAADAYTKVEKTGSKITSALASLGLAGVRFDQGKYAEAKSQYEKVKNGPLAARDADARARALEGIGLSEEAAAHDEAALTAFRELGNSDVPAFAALGEYHQARLLNKADKRDQAKALLKKALDRLSKPTEAEKQTLGENGSFLERQVRQLLAAIDPSEVPKPAGGMSADQLERLRSQLKISGDGKLDPKKIEELIKKLGQQQQGAPNPNSAPPASPAPQPAPAPAPQGSAP